MLPPFPATPVVSHGDRRIGRTKIRAVNGRGRGRGHGRGRGRGRGFYLVAHTTTVRPVLADVGLTAVKVAKCIFNKVAVDFEARVAVTGRHTRSNAR